MARPIRIEFSGALYHITARGNRRENIYDDDIDRDRFLEILGQVITDANWLCYAYCLMDNHYHLVIETPDGNLSKGMRQLNGVFTQTSNRRHRRSGHLFQGRYKAILVNLDSYLMELTRYVVLNPVRAGIVDNPGAWPWSSYNAMIEEAVTPPWLAKDRLLAQFAAQREKAVQHYIQFIVQGIGQESIWKHLNQQVFLGDDNFIKRMQEKIKGKFDDINIPQVQRRSPAKPLAEIAKAHKNRDRAIVAAYTTGEYSYQDIGTFFNLHFTTVGNIVRANSTKKIKAGK
ncbi:transposase [Nitrosomonas sp. Nm132]|uniref:REP-associated tyrosine transposase n=1 Tax=Nitrosomonas sp. Nm132 TaxID=1881053 RepID=UPI00087DF741|nr:transposase [Nitrosomonas sp. Nm132]SDH04937.1 REP element-mobilizing transposase RayT [Nitrosomonas sp. Nm132]